MNKQDLTALIQKYLGMQPKDVQCTNWSQMQEKMTDEILQLGKPNIMRKWSFQNSKRNWTEDFTHENGNYCNICVVCDKEFLGHKRRTICKECYFITPIPKK